MLHSFTPASAILLDPTCRVLASFELTGKGGLGYNCELASHHLWQFISQRPSVWNDIMNAALPDYYATGTYVSKPQLHSQQAPANPAAAGTAAAASPLWNARLRWSQRHRLRQSLLRFLLMAESGSEAGSANAAWMLMRGEGAGGPDAVDLAAELLLRWVQRVSWCRDGAGVMLVLFC
jgi:hypothetical protein